MRQSLKIRVLELLLTGIMMLTAMGFAPAAKEAIQGTAIEVKNVDELVTAVKPGADIALLPGEYALADAATYGQDTGNPYCRWEQSSEQGYELQIAGADGLTLRGAGMDKTTLLAKDRYANVLTFNGCKNVTVAGLTAGHSPAPGYCSGGVLYFANCTDVTVELCGLFGCGSMGVWAMNCSGVKVALSRIYECSDSAVSFDGCRNVLVEDCEIDHNGWRSEYAASCLFRSYGGDGLTVSACHVHDNTADILLLSSYTRSAAFLSNRVEYNTLQDAFALYQYPATVDGCAFHGNELGSWYAYGDEMSSLAALDAAGNELAEGDLTAMDIRPIQLSGTEEISLPEPTEVAPGGEITVNTVDDFLAAIGPDRTIVLDGDSFCLADASAYGVSESWYYRWEETYDGPQLTIIGASGLTIRGASEGTTLTAAPRYANVLGFRGCDGVRVSGLTLGHTEGPSDCSGAVLDFDGCNGVLLDGCRLYGCGTLGVNAYTCTDMALTDCEIYECSLGGVVLFTVYGASFRNCRIHDVPSPALSLYDSYEVTWNEAPVLDNHYDVTDNGELKPVAIAG